ncbi:inorganic phosphate transporter [Suttonella sp. R2A3]|uniref:inorganic phosphate transporter n=1 Tax=Suttonella sp. R2A3 TaxID=2908648 RepID=UPI001F2F946B|nr:inorganic phosphate transporter [Suttonella sp. R2A3]UJF25067.1 inorganic phosphate transporter [Suttonella sp. R2A3]
MNQTLQLQGFTGISRLSLFFAILLIGITSYFMWWGLNYTEYHQVLIFIFASLFGIFMAFNIGGNDVANSFGTSVGAGTLTITQALAVAAVFEVSGAVIAGGEVTDTIRKGIVDLSSVTMEPLQFVFIMTSALVAAAFWLLFATRKGWPVSTTHSIIGGIVGASITLGFMLSGASAADLVQWNKIGAIAVSWVLSPVLGGTMSYVLFGQIKKHILNFNDAADVKLKDIKKKKKALKKSHKKAFERLSELQQIAYTSEMARDARTYSDSDYDPEDLESDYYRELHTIEQEKSDVHAHRALQQWVPMLASFGAMIISAMLLFKGLKHLDLGLTSLNNYLIMAMVGAAVWMATFIYAKTLQSKNLAKATFLLFSWMQVFTAAGFAFSHGSNDIANAIGPFAAILDVLKTNNISTQAPVPTVAMVTFGIALVAGLWFIGKEVIATVGTNLAKMHPASGFSAELSAASVVMLASIMGLPVSSTHILVGAVLGIGLVNRNANWNLMKPIALAWVITLPAAAAIASIAFLMMNAIF